ncbi:MAG: ribonuclease HI family protein [Patescibacteria group bacterium]|jgi:ribonuclease HI
MHSLIIYTDGGARGNPGPAGIGVHIEGVADFKEYIGKATNNQAEYKAVVLALQKAKELGAKEMKFYLDSELVVKQLSGEYKIKDKELSKLFVQAWNLTLSFKKVLFFHVPREKNKKADKLVNEAIDDALK